MISHHHSCPRAFNRKRHTGHRAKCPLAVGLSTDDFSHPPRENRHAPPPLMENKRGAPFTKQVIIYLVMKIVSLFISTKVM